MERQSLGSTLPTLSRFLLYLLQAEVTRGEIGLPARVTLLWTRGESLGESLGECLGERPAGETSDPANVKTEVSEVTDQGDTQGDSGRDFRESSEEIFSLHSFFKLVQLQSVDMQGDRKHCLCKSVISTWPGSSNFDGSFFPDASYSSEVFLLTRSLFCFSSSRLYKLNVDGILYIEYYIICLHRSPVVELLRI